LNITEWLLWFTTLVLESQRNSKKQIAFVIAKARFWDQFSNQINERQRKVLTRMLRADPTGFVGGISAKKYTRMTGCSKPTATRDLTRLLKMNAVKKLDGGGRSTRYDIQLPEDHLKEKEWL